MALLVSDATEIEPGSLLLRAGAHSLTPNIDPTTERPGDLPNSCVDFIVRNDEGVLVVFRDGMNLPLDPNDYCEAVA